MKTIALALALATAAAAAPGVTRVPLYRHNSALDSLGGASRSSKNVAVRVLRGAGSCPSIFLAPPQKMKTEPMGWVHWSTHARAGDR